MKKYIRGMFRGGWKTKLYLWTIFLVGIVSLGCFGAAFMGAGLNFAYIAFGGSIFAVVYSQLGVFRDVNQDLKEDNTGNNRSPKKKGKETARGNTKKKAVQAETQNMDDNPYNRYTEDKINKLLVPYKVKKQSFLAVIDSSEKYQIKNCPAYIWGDKRNLYFLLLEKKVRVITVPHVQTAVMHYEKGIMVKDMEEYKELKDSFFLGSTFRDYIPEYYRTMVNGFSTFKKNLFVVASDIKMSGPSARGVMKITNCRLELDDSQLDKKRFGGYFEEAYKVNLLLREEVYDAEEYKVKIKEILTGLAEHEESIEAFRSTIASMIQYRLITDDYAEYFMNYRCKIEKKE